MFRNHLRRIGIIILMLSLMIPPVSAQASPYDSYEAITDLYGRTPFKYYRVGGSCTIKVDPNLAPYNLYVSSPSVAQVTNVAPHTFFVKFIKEGSAYIIVQRIGDDVRHYIRFAAYNKLVRPVSGTSAVYLLPGETFAPPYKSNRFFRRLQLDSESGQEDRHDNCAPQRRDESHCLRPTRR